jgi:cytochrome bd-type quinol oxidase subunit 2
MALNPSPLGEVSGFTGGFFKTAGSYPQGRFALLISNIITVFTIFAGLAFLLWFVTGALTWATSGGNPEQTTKAKNQMSSATAGLFVTVLSYAIIFILGKITGFEILNVEAIISRLAP